MFSPKGLACESGSAGPECGDTSAEYMHQFDTNKCSCNPKESVEWVTSMMLLSKTKESSKLRWYRNVGFALNHCNGRYWSIRIKRGRYSEPKSDSFIDQWRSKKWWITWKYPVCFNHYMAASYDLYPIRDEFGYTIYVPPWLAYGNGKIRLKDPVKYANLEKDDVPPPEEIPRFTE